MPNLYQPSEELSPISPRWLPRLLVSAAAGLWMLAVVDPSVVANHLTGIRPAWLMAALVVCWASQVAGVFRWQVLTRAGGLPLNWATLASIQFDSTARWSALGDQTESDVRRARRCGATLAQQVTAATTIVAHRAAGACALAAIGLVAADWYLASAMADQPLLVARTALLTPVAILAVAQFAGRGGLGAWSQAESLLHWMHLHRLVVLRVAAWAAVGEMLAVLTLWLVAQALGVELPLVVCAMSLPCAILVASVPILRDGWGALASVLAVVLLNTAVETSAAIVLAVSWSAVMLIVSSAGRQVAWYRVGPSRDVAARAPGAVGRAA